MPTNKERIAEFIHQFPGRDDDEIARCLQIRPRQAVNQNCRQLQRSNIIVRRIGPNGKLANYPSSLRSNKLTPNSEQPANTKGVKNNSSSNKLTEDQVKSALKKWLEGNGWVVTVAWGKTRGIDIVAARDNERWIIECKGAGSLAPMMNNYFIGVIGELLQRMDDDASKHSVAFPDLPKFRRLWTELPSLAKKRLNLTCLFASADDTIDEVVN